MPKTVQNRRGPSLAVAAQHESFGARLRGDRLQVEEPRREREVGHVSIGGTHTATVVAENPPASGNEAFYLFPSCLVVAVVLEIAPHVRAEDEPIAIAHHGIRNVYVIAGLRVANLQFHSNPYTG